MPEPSAPEQPRKPRRLWLFAPYVALLLAVLAWSGVWLAERARVVRALEDGAQRLRGQGYAAAWTALSVDGWPFRLHVTLTGPQLGESSGWSLRAPRLEAEALAYAPDRWVSSAPDGLVLTRPGKGALNVSGQAIRASVGALGSDRPRLSFEGLNLALAPEPGAEPAAFSSIDRLELHLQPGPDDRAAFLVRLDGGALRPDSDAGRAAGGRPFSLLWDSRLSHLSAFQGPNWPAAVQAWARAGGTMTVADGRITLGRLSAQGSGGPLTVDAQGRLQGRLPLKGPVGPSLALTFQDGRAAIGPIPLGPALKVG